MDRKDDTDMRDIFEADGGLICQFPGMFDGFVKYIEEFQLLRTDLWKRFVQQFKEDADYEAGWRGEYWGKMMRGACFVYSYSKNPKLYQVLTDTVKDMLTAQDEYGRISSYAISHEFDGWDLWSRKYVLLGMQYYLEICQDDGLAAQIVDSMCRFLLRKSTVYPEKKRELWLPLHIQRVFVARMIFLSVS